MIFCAAIAAIALYFTKPTVNKMIAELRLDEDDEDNQPENNWFDFYKT